MTYHAGETMPVFLLTMFPKDVKVNLSQAEQNTFAASCKRLVDSLGDL